MTKIAFSEKAWDDYCEMQGIDKKYLIKVNKLIKDAQRNPISGAGKPERLIGMGENVWSRRINDKDRLVYEIRSDTIFIRQCKGHYTDK